jgi:hypothetical protein
VQRVEAMAYRIHAQQLDREAADAPVTDAAILDLGVQDTGRDGASWALANRGFPVANAEQLEVDGDLALVWTLRSAPHYYRRADLLDVATATSPYSEADAFKRVFGAGAPLKAAGISTRDGLCEVARQLRTVVTEPMVKGEVSTALTAKLTEPYLRECRPCQAVHSWEIPFRVGALYAGLELEPGTSPPVLRRIPGWPRRRPGPVADPLAAPERLQPIRGYLRFLGPATPHDVAAFLDTPVAEIKAHWPEDAVQVTVDGAKAWMLGEPAEPPALDQVRLLGGFDLFLQAKDRQRIVPDTTRHKALWPVLGRPGAVLHGAEVIGTWRPKAVGRCFTLRLELWAPVSRGVRGRIEIEAERLAAHRGLRLAGVEET